MGGGILRMAAGGVALSALAACGGGGVEVTRTAFATGPIYSACLSADRPQASVPLCGCVQAVADVSLTGAEQRRAVAFFRDPHQAQVVRQSDRPRDEAFWPRYRAFAARAEQVCR
jgi:hypothetical protein